ncbi:MULTISPECIES: CGNR zinc finger domain-containing protein [Streptomyces]|uniref:CGNR zinc finger domain-containing protein n=1 Tax=Streptomyces TaxID=1883 RepID=UPI0019225DDB|nr:MULTISPECIES: CGNR zinc finger domain-containing protein [Streptomyces]MCM9079914.1 CGNR zinc finger domain-containing protein [Streptomyces spororaveus]MCX5305671.1 CGNR zinc finger domain-containing protein [Streptomyces sp. NBC_00160]
MTVTFPLTGEPLALDLLNTEAATGDLVADPAALTAWLAAQAGRLTPVDSVGEAEVAAVRAVREAARPALDAVRRGERPPAAALRALNEALAAAPSHRVLAWAEEGGITAAAHRPADPARRLAAELAEAVAELLTDPRAGQVRECEAHDCVLLFLPAHPRRRWCVASVCGNRARVARYYARHKGDTD